MTVLNGYLIQDLQRRRYTDGRYDGPAAYVSWPMETSDAELHALNRQVEEWIYRESPEGFSLWAIPNTDVTVAYARALSQLGRPRILLCSSDRKLPIAIPPPSNWRVTPIGWDLIGVAMDDSLVRNEVGPKIPELDAFSSQLNENGLFERRGDLVAFIAARNLLVERGVGLENADGYVQCHFSRVDNLGEILG